MEMPSASQLSRESCCRLRPKDRPTDRPTDTPCTFSELPALLSGLLCPPSQVSPSSFKWFDRKMTCAIARGAPPSKDWSTHHLYSPATAALCKSPSSSARPNTEDSSRFHCLLITSFALCSPPSLLKLIRWHLPGAWQTFR